MENHREIDQKWQQYWAANNTYAAEENSDKPKFYVLDMFPYPSGAGLHVGHPLGYIASDIFARYKRHKGFNVLHPMGYDSFGLPAEQYAIQTGQHPAITTENNITRYRQQLDQIGFSFDWNREVRTSNPDFYKWTQWIFIQLFSSWYDKDADKARSIDDLVDHFNAFGTAKLNTHCGEEMDFTAEDWSGYSEKKQSDILLNYRLAYRSESMVNWCPDLGTVLANDEVKDGVSERGGYPVVQKKMMQWSMRISAYAERLLQGLNDIDWSDALKETQRNWIGKSKGASVHFQLDGHDEQIEVFTTRPDTIFGVTFMVLAPEHELVNQITTDAQREEITAYQEAAARKSERDRMMDTKTVTGAFTGAYVVHPFSGEKVPVWIGDYVLAGYGTGAVMAVPGHDSRDHAFASKFELPIVQVVEGGDVAEAAVDAKEGKMMNSDFLNGLDVKEAIAKAISEIENRGIGAGQVNYRLRDAIFGRQRYWGEPIPVYYENGIPKTLSEDKLPLTLPEVDKYLPTEDGEPPLARANEWHTPEGHPLETTTMPGWAGSSWYFLRYMDAGNVTEFVGKEKVAYWQNVDLYVGGSEHATGHLLYARFWHKFLADRGFVTTQEPFKKLVNQGMIQGQSEIAAKLLIIAKLPGGGDKDQLPDPSAIQIFVSKSWGEIINGQSDGDLTPIFDTINEILQKETNRQKELNPEIKGSLSLGSKTLTIPFNMNVEYVSPNHVLDSDRAKVEDPRLLGDNCHFILENSEFITTPEVEKMSKSKYNVRTPDQIVEQYGADVLRMYEMFLGPIEHAKPWDTKGITGVSNFLRKMSRLFENLSNDEPTADELKSLHKCIKKINEDIENFSFNTSVSAFMICVNELTEQKCSKRAILEPLTILLSPFAPHTAEELWEKLGHAPSVTTQEFPTHNKDYLVESSIEYPVQFNGKTRFNIAVPADLDRKGIEEAVMADERSAKWIEGLTVRKVIVVPGRIVNIVVN
ncbi:MAG: leucine--tRNA ligase [Flavobacteriia bacterium]|nr:leucine--tRNA ligase [Flavobacteriia bacterium]